MRTQVYAALFAVVAAKTETPVEKKTAASKKTIADDKSVEDKYLKMVQSCM